MAPAATLNLSELMGRLYRVIRFSAVLVAHRIRFRHSACLPWVGVGMDG